MAYNPQISWEYLTAVSILSNYGDVDLYMSASDGRFPTSNDYDFKSENFGADDILINSNTSFFDKANYNLANGIIFVVGVKAITDNVTFSIMMNGPTRFNFSYSDISTTTPVSDGFNSFTQRNNQTTVYKTYRYFNWGGGSFMI